VRTPLPAKCAISATDSHAHILQVDSIERLPMVVASERFVFASAAVRTAQRIGNGTAAAAAAAAADSQFSVYFVNLKARPNGKEGGLPQGFL
jgi:hypothetical protein